MTILEQRTRPTGHQDERLVGLRQRNSRSGWIDDWDPDDPIRWEAGANKIAHRNLLASMFADHLGFCVWVVWTIVVLNLVNIGIKLAVSQLFLLTLLPNLVGALLRIPYTFAVHRFGGRAWTTVSAALLILPASLLAAVVPSGWLLHQSHGMQLLVLAICAATAGLGGGNFASSMANISYFYPEERKGWALGLNAAGGNLGTAVAQVVVPLVLIIGVPTALVKLPTHPVHMAYAGLVWIPLAVIAAFVAWFSMNSLRAARTGASSYLATLRISHTWILSLIYVGTFGSFIGFSFALPLVIKYSFPTFLAGHPFVATYLAGLGFTGALLGSLARPLGGRLADRFGGASVTLVSFIGMAASVGTAIAGVDHRNFALFFTAFQFVFVLAGIGNGSIYKLIPTVFSELGRSNARTTSEDSRAEFKRRAASAIGIAGAIGALGGVAVQVVIRQSSLGVSALESAAKSPSARALIASTHSTWSVPALWIFLLSYVMFAGVTWSCYVRGSGSVSAQEGSEES